MKKSKKIILFLIIIILIASIFSYLIYQNYFTEKEKEEIKVIKRIDGFNYNLNENETDIYKEEFYNLESILSTEEINYEEYAKQVAKLFIIDFYTLDNKLSKNDIGGLEFIKDSMKDNFIEEARSTFYKYLEVKSEKRNQELPIVNEITDVSVEKTSFTYSDKIVDNDAYRVTISWDYEEDLSYEKTAKMIIVKEEKKLYVIEMN